MATVFVIGAGPAGLFAAQKLALAGHEIVVLNRDIKPGGLAEYGIYPLKDKMKIGLRKQFAKVLALPNVHYFGHVPVGTGSLVKAEALREFCPAAILYAVGAQGTNKLGLAGEDAKGVYSAKDFVYHYNRLPPFASQDFSTGKRVAIVGMGNVMVDIARWLMVDTPERTVEEVIVIARRGPLEAKFDEKEFAQIQMHLDRKAFEDELRRVKPAMDKVGQDVRKVPEETFTSLAKYPGAETIPPRLRFRFLCSPSAIVLGPDGRIAKLVVRENDLVLRDGNVAAKATDGTAEIDVDTLIFAIGDKHDPTLGLPYGPGGYVTNAESSDPWARYEVFDPAAKQICAGHYVIGWARKASEGLVGIARHDGEVGAGHVLEYLAKAGPNLRNSASAKEVERWLAHRGVQAVSKSDLPFLTAAEEREAGQRGVSFYFFPDDERMLSEIERARSGSKGVSSSE